MDFLFLSISILIFIAIVFFVLGIFYNVEYRQGRWKLMRRIRGQTNNEGGPGRRTYVLSTVKKDLLRFVGSLGNLIKPKSEGEISHLRNIFLKAGYRGENVPLIFFGIKFSMAILFPIIFSLIKFFFMKTMLSIHFMLFALILALIGFYLPNLWVRNRISRRKEEIFKGFPNALDLMVVCVEAGSGLDAGINRVGEEMKLSNRVLSEEFKLLSLELRAGKLRREALKNFALRTDLEDVKSLVTLLIQTEKFGTSIGQALRVYSDSMRTKRYQRAEEAAAKLPVKLIFPLILFILPALFVTILGPGVIRIFKTLLPIMMRL